MKNINLLKKLNFVSQAGFNSIQFIEGCKIRLSLFKHFIATKKNICRLLDKNNFVINKVITVEENNKNYLRIEFSKFKKLSTPTKKICILGSYKNRYKELGFTWDGEARAFINMGYETLNIDIRHSLNSLITLHKIKKFRPDYIIAALKDGLPFLIKYNQILRKLNSKLINIYWFRDLRGIEGSDSEIPIKDPVIKINSLHGVIDFIFMSNSGQLETAKKYYGVKNAYFMAHSYSPIFMSKMNLKKIYDIGFTGSTDLNIFHRERTRLLEKLKRRFKVVVKNNIQNNTPEFYNRCKIVFGADVIGGSDEFHPRHYTSNRIFNVIGCGAFYLCSWFPGIEDMFINHYHLVWFKHENELFQLAEYYLNNDLAREKIQNQAYKYAQDKHTNEKRLKNLLDIVEGRTNKFEGFL